MTSALHPDAERELLEAARFYEKTVVGLGLEFIAEVERAASLIVANPEIGQRLDPILRRVLLKKFPFSVIYRTNASGTNVIAIAHQSRRPGYWRSRIE